MLFWKALYAQVYFCRAAVKIYICPSNVVYYQIALETVIRWLSLSHGAG